MQKIKTLVIWLDIVAGIAAVGGMVGTDMSGIDSLLGLGMIGLMIAITIKVFKETAIKETQVPLK